MAGLRVGFTISVAGDRRTCSRRCGRRTTVSALDQRAAVFAAARSAARGAPRARPRSSPSARGSRPRSPRCPARGVRERGEPRARAVRRRRAAQIWQALADRGIVVRNFDRPPGPLAGCLRITVGTPAENALLARGARASCALSPDPSRSRVLRSPRAASASRVRARHRARARARRTRSRRSVRAPHDTRRRARGARGYIERELRRHAVERLAVGDVDLPAIDVLGAHVARRATTSTPTIPICRRGSARRGKALLVMAHYDTVPGSPGAVDNAAAVARADRARARARARIRRRSR